MRKSELKIINPEITTNSLRGALSQHSNSRVGLRIAILQDVLAGEEIKGIADKHKFSRSQIYEIVDKVNKKGLSDLADDAHTGRKNKMTPERKKQLKTMLLASPEKYGYTQPRWDGILVAKHLAEKFQIEYTPRHCQRLMKVLGFSLQRGRKKYMQADPIEQEKFKEEFKKNIRRTRR